MVSDSWGVSVDVKGTICSVILNYNSHTTDKSGNRHSTCIIDCFSALNERKSVGQGTL